MHACVILTSARTCSSHRGQTPADAEYNFLEQAKRLDLYGLNLYTAVVRRYTASQITVRVPTCMLSTHPYCLAIKFWCAHEHIYRVLEINYMFGVYACMHIVLFWYH